MIIWNLGTIRLGYFQPSINQNYQPNCKKPFINFEIYNHKSEVKFTSLLLCIKTAKNLFSTPLCSIGQTSENPVFMRVSWFFSYTEFLLTIAQNGSKTPQNAFVYTRQKAEKIPQLSTGCCFCS